MENVNSEQVLLEIYAIERQDDLGSVSIYAVLLSAWLALLGVIGYVLLRDVEQPAWLLAFLPVAPLPLAGLGALLLAAGSARACLLDALEREIQQRLDIRASGAPVPSFHSVSRSASSRRFSRPVFVFGVYLPLIGLYFGVAGWSLRLAWEQNRLLAVLGIVAVGAPVYCIGRLAGRSLRHRALWRQEAEALVRRLEAAGRQVEERGVSSQVPEVGDTSPDEHPHGTR